MFIWISEKRQRSEMKCLWTWTLTSLQDLIHSCVMSQSTIFRNKRIVNLSETKADWVAMWMNHCPNYRWTSELLFVVFVSVVSVSLSRYMVVCRASSNIQSSNPTVDCGVISTASCAAVLVTAQHQGAAADRQWTRWTRVYVHACGRTHSHEPLKSCSGKESSASVTHSCWWKGRTHTFFCILFPPLRESMLTVWGGYGYADEWMLGLRVKF